ncbi:MAG TPA: glycosyltransferase family 4 protein [Candidatus Moranbacteria bacterium]|nr:glycosyltransferase family 4 protein [Candidatus Moranbacteria bacterium]HRZ33886.1 glycosyltransferase family 4 protein [Candidatus Moranbacteria bacterium]
MKKILLITRPITPPWDEASKNFAFFLAKNISNFTIGLLTKSHISELSDNVEQKPVYTSSNFSFLQKIRLLFGLKFLKSKFDILHFLFTPTRLNSFLIKKILGCGNKKFRTIQTIATLREDLYSDEEIKKMIFGNLIITYSDYAKNKLASLGFKNIERIYPGIDLDLYRKKEKNPEHMKKYGLSDLDFIINFTGEYSRLGAIDDVALSFIEISKLIPNSKLSLAVRIKNCEDIEKKKWVIEIFKRNNLLDRVIFHDDGTYEMSDIYNLCDISIFPVQDMKGKFDVPLAVIEAMACEKPVIISNIPILEEFAKEGNSVKIEKGNLSELKLKILDLYDHREKCYQIGKNARQYVEENFDIKKIAQQYKNIYNKL